MAVGKLLTAFAWANVTEVPGWLPYVGGWNRDSGEDSELTRGRVCVSSGV